MATTCPAIKSLKSFETALGTVASINTRRRMASQQKFQLCTMTSSWHPRPVRENSKDEPPVNLSFRALESRGKEKEKQTKSPLIVHHSMLGRKENWNPISEIINRTTQRKVITVDARNHGDSPHTKQMSLPLMTHDILHLVTQLHTPKISFLGHSMGGRIGIRLALTRPQVVDKLIVVDSSVLVNENSKRRWSSLRQACVALKKIEPQLKQAQGYERLQIANKVIENILVGKTDRANFLSNLILTDKPGQTSLWRVNMDSILAHPNMMSEAPEFNNVSFHGPTLFINGDKSKFVSREDEPTIKRMFPNSQFLWFKDCGHLLHVDKQREFCEKVITFLEKK